MNARNVNICLFFVVQKSKSETGKKCAWNDSIFVVVSFLSLIIYVLYISIQNQAPKEKKIDDD